MGLKIDIPRQLYLVGVIVWLAACVGATGPAPPPAPTSRSGTGPAPRNTSPLATPSPVLPASPAPAPLFPLLTLEELGFRFRYPPEFQVMVFQNGICLAQEQGYGPPGLCHVKSFSVDVLEAEGRSLDQMANELAAVGNPTIEVKRTSLTVAGEPAILLDDIYAQDVMRQVVVVYNERVYVLTFVSWSQSADNFARLENLYHTVIDSFAFLPLPGDSPGQEDESVWRISAITPVPIYSGPGSEYPQAGVLVAGSNRRVLESDDGIWMKIECPEGIAGSCWVLWDMNALYSYEGPPVSLNIPDPADLLIEATRTTTSPDGRWQVTVTQTETVSFGGEDAWFFYVELIVTSLEDGMVWRPLSEWHVYGLGHEYAPKPFQWSQDSRYLYFTSLFDLHGACAYFYNISDYLNRLDVTDGSVAELLPPQAFGIAAFSPDETMMAYLSDQSLNDIRDRNLVVREVASAYAEGLEGQEPVLWELPLDLVWPTQVSQLAWSPDSRKVLVTAAHWGESGCEIAGYSTWELDVETGAYTATSTFVPPPKPTPTAPTPCAIPGSTGGQARETYLIFCGEEDHVNISPDGALIVNNGLTVEAYVNYLGGGGVGPRVIEIIDTFNLSYAEGKVWFCLFSMGFATNQGNGWHCLTAPQPALNRWVHLAGSWDGDTMYLFIDGQFQAATVFPGPLFHGGPGDQSLKIGNGWTLIDGFHGSIDEVRFSSVARYRVDFEPQRQFTPDEHTVGLWHFDEGQGTVAADAGPYENHGALSPWLRWGPVP